MSVRQKILLVFGIAFLGAGFLLYFIGGSILLQGFSRIERDLLHDGVGRGRAALGDELAALSATCGDWAGWNDTRDFVIGEQPEFASENLTAATFVVIRVDFMCFYSVGNELLFSAETDAAVESIVEVSAELTQALQNTSVLFEHAAPDVGKAGFLRINGRTTLVASWPITNSDKALPIQGTLVIGRYFDADQADVLSARTRQRVTLQPLEAPETAALAEALALPGPEKDAIAVLEQDQLTISGYTALDDIYGAPVLLMGVHLPRTVLQQGIKSTRVFAGVLASLCTAALILLFLTIERVVLHPVGVLAGHVRYIQEEKDLSARLEPRSGDEIGALTTAFNNMVDSLRDAQAELEEVHRRLLETARMAGMSEVASGVLHNVGNVMTSVNVTAATLKQMLDASKLPNLEKAAAMLHGHRDDLACFLTADEKGRKLPEYLNSLASHLSQEHRDAVAICGQLAEHIRHTIEIIALQQSYAKNASVIEQVRIDDVIEDSLRINAEALDRHGVNVVRDFETLPPTPCDRHRTLQILVNLISNAKYAVSASSNPEKTVTVSLRATDRDTIRIAVSDTGIGIEPDNLTNVFAYGFTTRRGGHGIGLHAAALTAQELGGSLQARSDGPGRGATFCLELPARPRDRTA